MKRILVAIFLSLFIIVGCVIAIFFTNRTITSLQNDLEKIQINIKNFDLDSALKSTKKLEKNWEKQGKNLSTFMEHMKIESVDQAISALKANLETERLEDASIEVSKIEKFFHHIKETEAPTVNNIL